MSRRRVGFAVVLVVLALAAGLGWWLRPKAPASYTTAPVGRGDVVTTITASGSVNPEITVMVGTYVSGVIQQLSCDYNTKVSKGQLCAKIDPRPYQVVVDQDQAQLATAKAQLVKDQASLAYARIAHQRADLLWSQDSISHDAADAAQNAFDQAAALVRLDQAQVAQRVATLKAAQINLDYTNIISPVEGTVISRNVTAGQTVAASFQTPTLFLIARDLTRMQVDTNVSESDIGGAVVGAAVSFTVDAYPRHVFQGRVAQVRQAPISVQNVITYDVVVAVDNPDLLLKPGMTATARIETGHARGALRVPSQALRFTPQGVATPPAAAGQGRRPHQRTVWVLRDGKPASVAVTVGLDDDSYAEIRSGALQDGDRVIVGQANPAKAGRQGSPTPALRL